MQKVHRSRLVAFGTVLLALGVASLGACGDDDSQSNGPDSGSTASNNTGGTGGENTGGTGGENTGGTGGENTGGTGGENTGGTGGENTGGTGGAGDEVAVYLNNFGAWGAVDPPSATATAPVIEQRLLDVANEDLTGDKTWPFRCALVQHDIVERHEEILNFDSAATNVKPGLVLSGSRFTQGDLAPIPLRRAPITLSINVPGIMTSSVVVDNPTTASIQQGISTLQNEAAAVAGNYPAALSFEQEIVQSAEEMSYKLGVSASYDGGFASANFNGEFASQSTQEQYTVASKMLQSMYTITFAQDELPNARAFFSPDLTEDELLSAQDQGYLAPDDPPVFIGAVTYGRMVVFTSTSTEATTATNFLASIEAAGATWSARSAWQDATSSYLATLKHKVLAIGGNQADVTNAIVTGDWQQLYAGANILNSVPLRYTVHALTGTRPIAAIGDTTQFTTADCRAIEGWYDVTGPVGVDFTDISTNPTNSPVMAVGRHTGNYQPYKLSGTTLHAHPSYAQPESFLDVAVDDDGNAFLYDDYFLATWKMPAGTFDFYLASNDTGATGDSRFPLHFRAIDAGAPNWVVASQPQSPYLTLYQMDWDDPWASWVGSAEGLEIGTGEGPYFSAVGRGYIGRHVDGGVGNLQYIQANNPTDLVVDQTELNGIHKVSGVTSQTLYAVERGVRGNVVVYNPQMQLFDLYTAPPGNVTVRQLEATSGGRLWIIGDDGKVYGYRPGRSGN